MKSWRVSAVSIAGTSHLKSNLPCQDAFEWICPSPGLLLAAIADGAGSAAESRTGARIACRSAVEYLQENSNPAESIKESFRAARDAVFAKAEQLNVRPRELACTLIVIVATAEAVSAGQIGDGASLLENTDGSMSSVTSPPDSEYLNETVFLTGDDALSAVQLVRTDAPVHGVAMFSDGLQMLALKMPGGTPHAPFFSPLFKFLRQESDDQVRLDQLERFLKSPKITQRADDDLSLLVATLI